MVNEKSRKRLLRIGLAGTSFRQARLRNGVGSVGGPCASALAALFFLLAMGPAHFACQYGARPPRVFGGASVTLIATLESLTVSAAPMAPAVTAPGREPFPDGGSLAITSSWAVPANLTTIRMVCLAGGASAEQIDEMRGKGGQGNTVTSPRLKDDPRRQRAGQDLALKADAESRIVYAERAGESNQAFTRTDTLHVENKAPVPPDPHSYPSTSSLNVVVQAL
jgi:hypothetical protein